MTLKQKRLGAIRYVFLVRNGFSRWMYFLIKIMAVMIHHCDESSLWGFITVTSHHRQNCRICLLEIKYYTVILILYIQLAKYPSFGWLMRCELSVINLLLALSPCAHELLTTLRPVQSSLIPPAEFQLCILKMKTVAELLCECMLNLRFLSD